LDGGGEGVDTEGEEVHEVLEREAGSKSTSLSFWVEVGRWGEDRERSFDICSDGRESVYRQAGIGT
jgi:hypothetical protein